MDGYYECEYYELNKAKVLNQMQESRYLTAEDPVYTYYAALI